jgi:hypothetical protein
MLKKELIERIHAQIESLEQLPQHAMSTPLTHYDLLSLLLLLSQLLEGDCIADN